MYGLIEKNIHIGHRQRMRNRCLQDGAASLQTHELIEVLLYYCITMKDTNPTAHMLLNEYGTLSMMLDADTKDMQRRCSVSENTAIFFSIVSEIIKRCSIEKWTKKTVINSSELAGEFAVSLLSYEKYEYFYVVLLDNQNRLINSSLIAKGTVDQVHIYPRFVVEAALRHQASSVILAHNHPGGGMKPSFADIETTMKIVTALNSIDILVVDHIIVAENKYLSMADLGLLKNSI